MQSCRCSVIVNADSVIFLFWTPNPVCAGASKHSSKFSSRSGLSLQRIQKINLCLSRWAVAHPQLEKASLPNWFWVLLKCDLTHVWCTSCLAAANVASWGWRESQNVTNLIWGQLRKRVTFFQAIIPLSQLCEGSSVCYNSCSWYTRFFTSGHCALLKCNNFFVVVFFNPLMCCWHCVPRCAQNKSIPTLATRLLNCIETRCHSREAHSHT